VQSGTHPTRKQAVAACFAITPSAYIDTSVQSQPLFRDHAMRAADRDPAGGEIPMMRRSQPQFRPSPCEPYTIWALCAWGVVSNKAQKQKVLMSEAMGIALPTDALATKPLSQGGPYFCAIKKTKEFQTKEVQI